MTSGHPAHKPAEVSSNCEGEKDNSSVCRGVEDKPTESVHMHVPFSTLKCV